MNRDKQIEEMAFDLCVIDTCKHLPKEECGKTTCAHCEAEALYNAGYRKQSEWISVDEALPETQDNVLVFCLWQDEWQVRTGWYGVASKGFYVDVGYARKPNLPITHWMPLPEAPKMKGGEADA